MRTLALSLIVLALLTLTAPASAAPADCTSQTVDGAFVKATVQYGTECRPDASAERCTLQSNPEYPSHPYWHCEPIL